MNDKLKTAVRIILPLWMAVKLFGLAVSFLTVSEVDLVFLHPAMELGMQALVFIPNTALGLGVYIGFLVVLVVCFPASFLLIPDNRVQNIIGFFAFGVITLLDIVSVFVLGLGEGVMLLSLALHLLMLGVVLCYGKLVILSANKASDETEEKKRKNC